MKFDIYCHFIPPVAKELIFEKQQAITEIRNNAALHDLDERFRIMDKYPDVMQILTVPGATPDDLAEPGGAPDLAKRINDDLAELVFRYTDRFVGAAAVVPISDIDATLDEIDRAVNELKLRGILLRIPINGKPMDREEFFPVYAKMCEHNLPIWIHPHQSPNVPDYADETESKYIIWHMWGLIYETTVTTSPQGKPQRSRHRYEEGS
jgi:predicted TIM-barrel fold metal-dependent hydrolase